MTKYTSWEKSSQQIDDEEDYADSYTELKENLSYKSKSNPFTTFLKSFLFLVFLAYAGGLGALYYMQDTLIFKRTTDVPVLDTEYLSEMRVVQIENLDKQKLLGWYAPPRNRRPTVLFFHGNAGDLSDRADKLRAWIDSGYGILIFSYRGFSGNSGIPTESGLYADAEAALTWLKTNAKIQNRDIILYGESLGTGVAAEVALTGKFRAVILDAPYVSIPELAQDRYWFYPVLPLVRSKFDTASRIGNITSPLLIIHGSADVVVPPHNSETLFNLAKKSSFKQRIVIPEARHNELYERGVFISIREFLRKA